jgi:hypothetical protein
MALHITRRDIEDAHRYARDAVGRVGASRGPGAVMGRVTRTAEVAAGAVGVGIASGYFGPLNIAGSPVPLDLAAGVATHLLAFAGIFGDGVGGHLHNLADGMVAGYMTKFGVGYGKSLAQKAGRPISPVFSGVGNGRMPPGHANRGPLGGVADAAKNLLNGKVFTGAEPLSEQELAAMAQAVR